MLMKAVQVSPLGDEGAAYAELAAGDGQLVELAQADAHWRQDWDVQDGSEVGGERLG